VKGFVFFIAFAVVGVDEGHANPTDLLQKLARDPSEPDLSMTFVETPSGKQGEIALRSTKTSLDQSLRIRIDMRDPVTREWHHKELRVRGRNFAVDRANKTHIQDSTPSPLMYALGIFDPASRLLIDGQLRRTRDKRRKVVTFSLSTKGPYDKLDYVFVGRVLTEIKVYRGSQYWRFLIKQVHRDLARTWFYYPASGVN
jgi:hypothetical protein